MTPVTSVALRVLERIHGHVGWLAALALLHPAILLRRPRRRAVLAASLATSLATAAGALGVALYPPYRAQLKQRLFVTVPTVGWLFERKEHLAVGAIALAWIGLVAHLVAPRVPGGPARDAVARLAFHAYALGAAMALVTAILGLVVSAHGTF